MSRVTEPNNVCASDIISKLYLEPPDWIFRMLHACVLWQSDMGTSLTCFLPKATLKASSSPNGGTLELTHHFHSCLRYISNFACHYNSRVMLIKVTFVTCNECSNECRMTLHLFNHKIIDMDRWYKMQATLNLTCKVVTCRGGNSPL
jgi:hypothetical protein